MTPRRIRTCAHCTRLALRRLCSRCFDELHAATIARGIVTRPAHPLLPTTVAFPDPQPRKTDHD